MAKKKTREQQIADLNDSIRRTNRKISNAQNEINSYNAAKASLQDLHNRLEAEAQTMAMRNYMQPYMYTEPGDWRGDFYLQYQYRIDQMMTQSTNTYDAIEQRLETIQREINRLSDIIGQKESDIYRWDSSISNYRTQIFWLQ